MTSLSLPEEIWCNFAHGIVNYIELHKQNLYEHMYDVDIRKLCYLRSYQQPSHLDQLDQRPFPSLASPTLFLPYIGGRGGRKGSGSYSITTTCAGTQIVALQSDCRIVN